MSSVAGYESQAWLLRTWRTKVAGLTQHEVGQAVHVKKSVVSMWENAARGLSFEHLHALDACYGAGGALAGTALVMGTPAGLPARTTWVNNPSAPSHPLWAWCRPRQGRRRIALGVSWGAQVVEHSAACDDMGVFVLSPVCRPDPPVRIELNEPGWVDFGVGAIPPNLGIPILRTPFELGPAEQRPAPNNHVLDLTRSPSTSGSGAPFTGHQWRLLRNARCLSRRDAAARATALVPEAPISKDQVAALERGDNPRPLLLRSRLDRVYQADGHSCLDALTPRCGRSGVRVDIPRWWIGPIWLKFATDSAGPAHVEIRHGLRHKQLLVANNTTVTHRKPTEEASSVDVYGPSGLRVEAGMGVHPSATNIEHGWSHGS